jgi:hypothetical protein
MVKSYIQGLIRSQASIYFNNLYFEQYDIEEGSTTKRLWVIFIKIKIA